MGEEAAVHQRVADEEKTERTERPVGALGIKSCAGPLFPVFTRAPVEKEDSIPTSSLAMMAKK